MARMLDPLKTKADAEYAALNPPPKSYVAPLPKGIRRRPQPTGRTKLERATSHHENLYDRFKRRYRLRIANTLIAADIRYWEMRICGMDESNVTHVLWFNRLAADSRMHLCELARERKRIERRMRFDTRNTDR